MITTQLTFKCDFCYQKIKSEGNIIFYGKDTRAIIYYCNSDECEKHAIDEITCFGCCFICNKTIHFYGDLIKKILYGIINTTIIQYVMCSYKCGKKLNNQMNNKLITPLKCTSCNTCNKDYKTFTCTRCKTARYCSFNCQKIGWNKGHKNECKVINKKRKNAKFKDKQHKNNVKQWLDEDVRDDRTIEWLYNSTKMGCVTCCSISEKINGWESCDLCGIFWYCSLKCKEEYEKYHKVQCVRFRYAIYNPLY